MAIPADLQAKFQAVSDDIDAVGTAKTDNDTKQAAATASAKAFADAQTKLGTDEQDFLTAFNAWIVAGAPPHEVKKMLQDFVAKKTAA